MNSLIFVVSANAKCDFKDMVSNFRRCCDSGYDIDRGKLAERRGDISDSIFRASTRSSK